jgi:hypothetical protein
VSDVALLKKHECKESFVTHACLLWCFSHVPAPTPIRSLLAFLTRGIFRTHLPHAALAHMQVVQERSLDWLCRKVLKRRLPKESKLRCGDWEAATLSSEQVAYAALDAAVSLQLHTAMAAMREIHLPQCDDGNDDEG